MYRILIVDDKTIIRKGLIKMLRWQELDAELAGEAENGDKALKMITTVRPDIIITDIRMPGADGITLLKNIHQDYPHIQTIVISGYDDFEYAQQAIKNGSLDYILKPVNSEELNNSIKNACEVINRQKLLSRTSSTGGQLDELFHKAVYGIGAEEPEELIQFGGYMFCVAAVRSISEKPLDFNQGYESIKNNEHSMETYTVNLDRRHAVLVFCRKGSGCGDVFETMVAQNLEVFLSHICLDGGKAAAGLGKKVDNAGSLKESYQTAYKALSYYLLNQNIRVLKYSDFTARKLVNIPVETYENEFLIHVTSGNIDKVGKLVNHLFEEICIQDDISMDSIKLLISNLCHLVIKLDTSLSSEIQGFLSKINHAEYLVSFTSMDQIEQILHNLFEFATRKYMDAYGGKESIVNKARNFILRNYSSDIGLEEMAKLFHVNASYLSKIFKQETGENINEYITKIRIESAKKLLKSGNVKIPQLSQIIGYTDCAYFYKVFKKITGLTPGEYQKRC